MERLKCKACGCYSMVPVELEVGEVDEEDRLITPPGEHESRFFSCHVCGDNWLSVKMVEDDGDCRVTFVHQMGIQPTLKRVAHVTTPIVISEDTVAHWDYYLGDDEVEAGEWRDHLDRRRSILKAICSN